MAQRLGCSSSQAQQKVHRTQSSSTDCTADPAFEDDHVYVCARSQKTHFHCHDLASPILLPSRAGNMGSHHHGCKPMSRRFKDFITNGDMKLVKSRHQGRKKNLVFGGRQLFLDMMGAFDAMPREHLQEAFCLLGLPSDLSALLLSWHTETSYVAQWKGLSAEQATHRGVRQGCRGAPYFWACFIALVLNRVAAETSISWMRNCCTF